MRNRSVLTPVMIVAGLAGAAALTFSALTPATPVAEAARSVSSGWDRLHQEVPTPGPGAPGRRGPGFDPDQMRQQQQAFMNAVAAKLGVTPETLGDAFKQARIDQVNRMVQEGRLRQEQADAMIQRIQTGPGPGMGMPPPNQFPGRERQKHREPEGREAGPGRLGVVPGPALGIAAKALGVTPREIVDARLAGQSLAEFALSKGVSRDDLVARMLTAQQTIANAAVAGGALTEAQGRLMMARFEVNLERLLDAKLGPRQRTPA